MEKDKQLYDLKEVAEITGINKITLWRNLKKGNIPSIRIGLKYYIPKKVVDEWLEKNNKDEGSIEL